MSATNANGVSHFWASQNTPLGTELWEPHIYIWVFPLKAVYNSCKLQRLLQVAKFLFMYLFTTLHFRHLPAEILIFKLSSWFVARWGVSVGIVFPFFRNRFCWYSTCFFDFMWSSNKVFIDIKIFSTVQLRPFIRYQCKNLDLFWIGCCFQFFLHCLVQPNQVIYFLFYVIFIIRIWLWIF